MKKVKEAQSLVNSAVDPLMSVLGVIFDDFKANKR